MNAVDQGARQAALLKLEEAERELLLASGWELRPWPGPSDPSYWFAPEGNTCHADTTGPFNRRYGARVERGWEGFEGA